MKRNAIVRIVLYSVGIIVLLSILLAGLGISIYQFEYHTQETHLPVASDGITSWGAVNADNIREIEVEWVAGSVSLYPVDNTDQISLSETGNDNEKYNMVYRQDGNTLKIQYCKDSVSFPSFGFNANISKDLVITVPSDWACDALEIETASAQVNVTDLIIGELNFDGASGICNITNCHVDKMDVDSASGDIKFKGTLNTLDCDVASANCRIYVSNNPKSIDIDTASGDLELMLPEDCGFSCSHETLSGRFLSELETTHTNGMYVHGDGSCKINIDAMSGDINIRENIYNHNDHHSE